MIKRKLNYLSIKSFLVSLVIVIFTGFALSAYSQIEQITGLKTIIITTCFLLSILINLETIIEESKYSSFHYNICRVLILTWYICFSIISYKYLLTYYEK